MTISVLLNLNASELKFNSINCEPSQKKATCSGPVSQSNSDSRRIYSSSLFFFGGRTLVALPLGRIESDGEHANRTFRSFYPTKCALLKSFLQLVCLLAHLYSGELLNNIICRAMMSRIVLGARSIGRRIEPGENGCLDGAFWPVH